MNLFLIWITAFIRRKEYTLFRWIFASVVVALLSLIYKWRALLGEKNIPAFIYCFFCVALLTGISFTYKGYKKKMIIEIFIKDMLILLFCAILTAGGILLVRQHIGITDDISTLKAFVLMLLSFVILYVLFFMMRNIIRNEAKKCKTIIRATLVQGNVHMNINVLYDTGNNLISPYTNEPVNIISEEIAVHTGIRNIQKPLLIPYKSIGGDGLLETFRFEKIVFQDGEVMENFLGALSEKIDNSSDVQMILNCSGKKTKK